MTMNAVPMTLTNDVPQNFWRYQSNWSRTHHSPTDGFIANYNANNGRDDSRRLNLSLVRACINHNGPSGYICVSDNLNWVIRQANIAQNSGATNVSVQHIDCTNLREACWEVRYSNLTHSLWGVTDVNRSVFIFRPDQLLGGLNLHDFAPPQVPPQENMWLALEHIPAHFITATTF